MADGFDTSELEAYERDLISLATTTMPRESKKFLKKNATNLSKEQKKKIKSLGVGSQGITEKEIAARSKSGKVYKYSGDLSCRAFNSHPLAHLLDQGFIHKGGFGVKDGAETWVPGYKFIEKAQQQFQSEYYQNVQEFIDNMLDQGL